MTEQMPSVPPQYPPVPPYAYGPPAGWMPPPPPRTHAELTWQDLMACITAFFGISLFALLLGVHSHDQAKKQGLKMHAAGMIGLIFGAIGTAGWILFWGIITLGATAGAVHNSSAPAVNTATTSAATTGQQINSWYYSGGKSKIDAVTSDLTAVGTAGTNQDWAGMQASCTALAQDSSAAYAYSPIPEPSVQDSWQKGLAAYNKAANECVSGSISRSAPMLNQAAADIRYGTSYVQIATARVNSASQGR
jgi:hypothetical protein